MRVRRAVTLIAAVAVAGWLVPASADASAARAHAAKATMMFFFKTTSQSFTNASGKPVSNPAPGDILFATDDMYTGTKAHHASAVAGTAFLYCTVRKVTKSAADSSCDAVVALGGSMLISQSTQNIEASSMVYPIVAGTGRFLHTTGQARVRNVNASGTESDGVFTLS